MTYNKKTIPFVFAFAALMLAWPMTAQTANADGDATSDPTCPVTIPPSIAFGNVVPGVLTAETSEFTFATPGNVDGLLKVVALDWFGQGSKATGTYIITTAIATDEVVVNGVTYAAVDSGPTGTQWVRDASDSTSATNLAAIINSNEGLVTARAVENVVIITAVAVGTSGNGITMVSNDATIVADAATLTDGEADNIKHMESEATKVKLTTDGSSSTGADYTTGKQAFGTGDTDVVVLTARTDATQDVKATFQVTGIGMTNLPYSGNIDQGLTFTITCLAE